MWIFFFVAAFIVPLAYFYLAGAGRDNSRAPRARKAVYLNIILFSLAFLAAAFFIFSTPVTAAEAVAASTDFSQAAGFIAAALVTGLGALGTGIAVSNTAAAAIGAVSENPDNFGRAMIFVAMAEGIAIYGLLIAFMILGRV
jgi:V/A-type H+-transporting ATPase subunit K